MTADLVGMDYIGSSGRVRCRLCQHCHAWPAADSAVQCSEVQRGGEAQSRSRRGAGVAGGR
jgi:hypothetical protein